MSKFFKVMALSAASLGLLTACGGSAKVEVYTATAKGYVEEAYVGDVSNAVTGTLTLSGSNYILAESTSCVQISTGNVVHYAQYVVSGTWSVKSEDAANNTKVITLAAATSGWKVVDGNKTSTDDAEAKEQILNAHIGKGGDYTLHTDTNQFDLVYVQGILF